MALTIDWITLELPLPVLTSALIPLIKQQLQQRGEPLRWAITRVNSTTNLITVEAVVIVQARR
ncbi:MAG: hypothetical protein KGQ93_09100 [Cyanobacteria bacterium REEB459]|nr:hypothetical protein [Cyanobacteria bacterium REEB459]